MQTLAYIGFISLCVLSLLGSGLPLQCSNTEYAWPVKAPKQCCAKCPPGEHLASRKDNCIRNCKPCPAGQYINTYNVDYSCKTCAVCDKPNMEYQSHCSNSHDTKCRCKAGYTLKSQLCVLLPTSTTASKPPTPSVTKTTSTRDIEMWWLPVIVILLCAVIVLLVLTKLRVFLRWIRSTHGYFLAVKPATVPVCTDDGVSKPVQEMCGKCDQPIELRV